LKDKSVKRQILVRKNVRMVFPSLNLMKKIVFGKNFVLRIVCNRKKSLCPDTEFLDAVFAPDVRMNGERFAPNRMFIQGTVLPQLTIRTHRQGHTRHTHQATTKAAYFIEKRSAKKNKSTI
jgi:hypothetical protein